MTTRVFIIPAAYKDAGNQMAEALGWGSPVFVKPLSSDGSEPITHWGFPSIVQPEFLDLWDNPPEEAAPLVAVTQVDTRGVEGDEYGEGYSDTAGHWWDTLAELGLVTVVQDATL